MEKEWEKSGFESPEVFYAVNSQNGESFLVIEDDSTIYRLMNNNGQVYVIADFRCKKYSSKEFLNGTPFYSCEDRMHPISCSKIESAKDRFVFDKLRTKYL